MASRRSETEIGIWVMSPFGVLGYGYRYAIDLQFHSRRLRPEGVTAITAVNSVHFNLVQP
jgi:hypothetical protein